MIKNSKITGYSTNNEEIINNGVKSLITLTLEEYKELLEYKGRYLELKERGYYPYYPGYPYKPTITFNNDDWWKKDNVSITRKTSDDYPYTITANIDSEGIYDRD